MTTGNVTLHATAESMLQQPAISATAPSPPPAAVLHDPPLRPRDGSSGDAPPKQVAQAMERLARAGRLIANIRLGADRILEGLYSINGSGRASAKAADMFVQVDDAMTLHFRQLRALGGQLEESGVLNGALKARGNSWGLHMPLVCPDGAVVAYAWKRQLAGQAGASAVDRTCLALKAFTDQKRRYFPHLKDEVHFSDADSHVAKRHCSYGRSGTIKLEVNNEKTLIDVLKSVEGEITNMRIFTHQHTDWLKRAAAFGSMSEEDSLDTLKEQILCSTNKLRSSSMNYSTDHTAVVEILVPLVFRAVLSLHPAGSANPDAVAFFSPSEEGTYVHARGESVHHVFQHVQEHAEKALQHFTSVYADKALHLLLRWITSYRTLFTKACSKCGRHLVMDKSLAVFLPPIIRPFRLAPILKSGEGNAFVLQNPDLTAAYHIDCSPGC